MSDEKPRISDAPHPHPLPGLPGRGEQAAFPLRISRRAFGRITAAAAAAAVAQPALTAQLAPASPPRRYIDVHTHLGQTWNHTRELTAGDLLKWMDEHDIENAVVMPLVSPEASTFLLTTDFVLAQ